MASEAVIAAVKAHVDTLLAGDAAIGAVVAVRNLTAPEPPATVASLAKAYVYLVFPPTQESASVLDADAPWFERGAFIVHVAVKRATGAVGEALAADVLTRIKQSLKNRQIGAGDGAIDILEFFGSDLGERWGGLWWGQGLAVSFYRAG